MLRAVIKRAFKDPHSGAASESPYTVDFSAPALERELSAGGYGDGGYDVRTLLGVEVRRDKAVPSRVYRKPTLRSKLVMHDILNWREIADCQLGDGDLVLFAVPVQAPTESGYFFEYSIVRVHCETLYEVRYLCNGNQWEWVPSDAQWAIVLAE